MRIDLLKVVTTEEEMQITFKILSTLILKKKSQKNMYFTNPKIYRKALSAATLKT